jgi:hypothetical protein
MVGVPPARAPGELFRRTWFVFLVVLGAVLVTCLVLFFDWLSSPPKSKSFVETPWFLIWAVLLCAQSALWAVLAPMVWTSIQTLRHRYRFGWDTVRRIAISSVVVAVLVGAFVYFAYRAVPGYPFDHHKVKILVLTAAGFFVALSALIGLWLVEAAVAMPSFGGTLAEYLELRGRLQGFLAAAAAIVGAAMLATGGLRTAITSNVPGAKFPSQYSLYYGAYLSVVLLIAYLPAHLALRRVGEKLLDEYVPVPTAVPRSWSDWLSERGAVESLLQLDAAFGKSLQTGLAIATPFIGSAIGVLLGTH